MSLVDRAKNILLQPAREWPAIAAEPAGAKALFVHYAVPLAAISAVASWIGHSLIGVSAPFAGTFRAPFMIGLALAVATFALQLAVAFGAGLIIDALAPSFGGEKNRGQALKCAVYAYTPAWVAGVLNLFPVLAPLVAVVSLYGVYLCYLGLPVLMKAPAERALGYTAVVVICAITLSIVLAVAVGLVGFGGGAITSGGPWSGRRGAAPAPDSVLGKLDALGRKLEESNRKLEDANRNGDAAAAADAAMEGLASMASGGKKVAPIPVDRLKAFLPETLDGLERADLTTEQTSIGPMSVTTASAAYRDGHRSVRIGIGDMAAASGLLSLTALIGAGQSRETDAGYERIRRVDGRLVIERQNKRSGAAEYGVVVADRFVVNASSANVDVQALRTLVARLDTAKLEALKDAAVR